MSNKTQKSKMPFVPYSIFHIPYSRGFTILFAVLIGSLLLSLGIFIAHLSLKEIVLSAAGKNSETAFFAADTGIECALYFDFRVGGTFPKSNEESMPPSVDCNGGNNPLALVGSPTSSAATSTFTLSFAPSGCAIVTVGKTVSGSTVIESRGRNDCGAGVNPGRVERALRVRY